MPAMRGPVLKLFAFALAIRWLYALALYATMGNAGIMSGDSFGYLHDAETIAAAVSSGTIQGWDLLGPNLSLMPIFPWLGGLNVMLAGNLAPLTTVMTLGLLDAGTCLLIYGIAATIVPRFAAASGIAAAINPTQVIISGLFFTDTVFVFFATLALFGSIRWLRAPNWNSTLIVAAGIGGAALTRIVIVPWVPFLILFLLAASLIRGQFALRNFAQLAAIGLVALLSTAPILARNLLKYDAWALTPQGGAHLALWVVPLVKESQDGTPWSVGSKQISAQVRRQYPERSDNPFVESKHYAQVGREMLLQFGVTAIAKAWLTGAAINLAAPAVIISPAVSTLPRTGFYDTHGAGTLEKIANFLFRSDNALYAWMLLLGVAGVAAIRLVQLTGLIALLRESGTIVPLLLLGCWVGYILAVNGPVASPKYRLPIEPVLAILTGAGFCTMRDRFRKSAGARPAASGA